MSTYISSAKLTLDSTPHVLCTRAVHSTFGTSQKVAMYGQLRRVRLMIVMRNGVPRIPSPRLSPQGPLSIF
jgi:hypothetical protein